MASIRVKQIPNTPEGYNTADKYIMIHDLNAPDESSTKLLLADTLKTIKDGNYGIIRILNGLWSFNNNGITLNKVQKIGNQKLLGNPNETNSDVTEIGLSDAFAFENNQLILIDESSIQKVRISKQDDGVIAETANLIFDEGFEIVGGEAGVTIKFNVGKIALSDGDYGDLTIQDNGNSFKIKNNTIDDSHIKDDSITFNKLNKIDPLKLIGNPTDNINIPAIISLSSQFEFNNEVLTIKDKTSIQKIEILRGGTLQGTFSGINFNSTFFRTQKIENSDLVDVTFIGAAGGGNVTILNNGELIGEKPMLNFINENDNMEISFEEVDDQINIKFSNNLPISTSILIELYIPSATSSAEIKAGMYQITNELFGFFELEIIRNNINIPMIKPPQDVGGQYAKLEGETITLLEVIGEDEQPSPLFEGEYLKIKKI